MEEDKFSPFVNGQKIRGFCPMGCGETLVIFGGFITCTAVTCPRKHAVSDIIQDEITEHVVDLKKTSFTVRHPLRERLDDQLLDCDLHAFVAGQSGPPEKPGAYTVIWDESLGWIWEKRA